MFQRGSSIRLTKPQMDSMNSALASASQFSEQKILDTTVGGRMSNTVQVLITLPFMDFE